MIGVYQTTCMHNTTEVACSTCLPYFLYAFAGSEEPEMEKQIYSNYEGGH